MQTVRRTTHVSPADQERRRQALLAAERSGLMEGLPPASQLARDFGERYATGELTADQAVAGIIEQYKGR